MHVMKFGGSSLGTPERIRGVVGIVRQARRRHRNVLVVCSAFEGITDQLIATSRQASRGDRKYLASLRKIRDRHTRALAELVPARLRTRGERFVREQLADLSGVLHGVLFTEELTDRTLDYTMSFGELLSTYIVAEALSAAGLRAGFVDSRLLIKTDDTFGAARVRADLTTHLIRQFFHKHGGVQCACGFIASTADNDTTTIGRGGSDLSASVYGAALGAREIEIWTDVDGVMTADPRKVEKAFSIPRMTYEEAMEMSHFGAKVIHPPTMQPALDNKIPIRIRNTFNPAFPGTLIGKRDAMSPFLIKGISSIDEVALLRIQGSGMVGIAGIGRRVFSALAKEDINVLMVTQASSEYSLCLAVAPSAAGAAKRLVEEELKFEIRDRQIESVVIEGNLSAVAVVGANMRRKAGISGKLFRALGRNGINVAAIAQGSSELNISTIVDRADEAKALNALHDAFFLSGTKSLHLFLVGTGLIGGALLRQIAAQREVLRKSQSLDLRVVAVANSRRMVFDGSASLPGEWRRRMGDGAPAMHLETFVRRMREMNLPNSVFVDCTASDAIVAQYRRILESSISIVTPNKKANAGAFALYERLHRTALRHNVRFLYETNVGAGLPIINTINDLIAGGDRILKIEGVLSGTLSYLFNSFTAGKSFASVVAEARKRGYTEPDPRDDLEGTDVGRKLLILAREAGHPLELREIKVKPLIPRRFRGGSVERFLAALPRVDAAYAREQAAAASEGNVLRYLASFAAGKAVVGLSRVPPGHPCFALSGSEISIALTTANCRDQPVVIRGPGAGADVTATGVLADIIRISYQEA
ncbi:MAG TPA: bifunctional aspartate kinase/homoserine dehydrogenase I [Bacteroidota bacterium]|nr:bifunctional aspartate kinase/homoserine dehydrogenase I [Bacteroidota bacterium]